MNELEEIKQLSDAGKRMSDAVNLHLIAHSNDIFQITNKWCAFNLQTGETDNIIYDSKDEAIRNKRPYEKQYCYLKILPNGISPKEASHFIKINRHSFVDTTAPEYVLNPLIYKPSATIFNPGYNE